MRVNGALCLILVFWVMHLSAYEVIEVRNGGAIFGTVKYTGKKFTDTLVKVGTHAEYCGEWVNPGSLMISEKSGIKWAVVMITNIDKGKGFDSSFNPFIHNVNCRFEPRVSIIKENLPITLLNDDKIPHRAKFGLVDGTGGVKNIMALAVPWTEYDLSATRIIGHTGLVSVAGIVHPFEQGWIWKLPHPYAAVTDSNGNFKITNIPQGNYKIRIWHELLGEQEMFVKTIKDKTKYLKVEFQD